MTDLVFTFFSCFKVFSYECQSHWVPGPLDTDVKSWDSSTCFPSAGRTPGTLPLSALFTPGVQGSLPSRHLHFPRATPHPRHSSPHLPRADFRQALGEGSSICQFIDKEGCFFHGLARQSLLSHLFLPTISRFFVIKTNSYLFKSRFLRFSFL